MKQYVPKKPIRRGFKVWVVADSSNGYFLDVDVYVGKASDGVTILYIKLIFFHLFQFGITTMKTYVKFGNALWCMYIACRLTSLHVMWAHWPYFRIPADLAVVSPNGVSREFICVMTSSKHKNGCRFLLLSWVEESLSTDSTRANWNSELTRWMHKSLFWVTESTLAWAYVVFVTNCFQSSWGTRGVLQPTMFSRSPPTQTRSEQVYFFKCYRPCVCPFSSWVRRLCGFAQNVFGRLVLGLVV